MKTYSKVCLGGTFDQIHLGHKSLLEMAFSLSDNVIIGLTTNKRANKNRKLRDLEELKIVTIPLILAKDNKKISSTRIRNNEIDINGNKA